jgi:hypothetical protein
MGTCRPVMESGDLMVTIIFGMAFLYWGWKAWLAAKVGGFM